MTLDKLKAILAKDIPCFDPKTFKFAFKIKYDNCERHRHSVDTDTLIDLKNGVDRKKYDKHLLEILKQLKVCPNHK